MSEVTTPYAQGTPCWIDLAAPDQQAAIDFYKDLFGWSGEVGPEEFGGYAMMLLNDKPVAGIMAAMSQGGGPPAPTVWTTYLAATDLDATSAKITEGGGTVMFPAMDVGTTGRMLIAADPTGGVFGAWQPLEFFGAQRVNEPGALTWNELNTGDPERAATFYADAFGVTVTPMPEMPEYRSIEVAGRSVGGLQHAEGPAHWMTYFAVDDVDSTVDAHVRARGDLIVPAFDAPGIGRIAVLRDPQGAVFSVIKSA